MFCPFHSLLLAQGRYKVQAMAAIRRGVAKQKLHVRDLDDLLSAVYVEVTTALHENGPDFFTNTLIFFITTVNERPALKSWTKRLSVNRFINIFLSLRAARLSWHNTPWQPFNITDHCKLVR